MFLLKHAILSEERFGLEDKNFVFALNMTEVQTDKRTVWKIRQTLSDTLTQSGYIHTGNGNALQMSG